MKTSRTEIIHLLRAWIAISIAFAIAFQKFSISTRFMIAVLVAAVTVGVGFIVHELAHKLAAQRYGCFAEFRANNKMLILALIISFTGIVFAAPGAVVISGKIDKRRNGIISAAGPFANMVLALFFLNFMFSQTPIIGVISFYGFFVNSWLALFNLIPLGNMDGAKILRWNKPLYALLVLFSAALTFMRSFI